MSTKELLARLGPDKEQVDAAMRADLAAIESELLAKVIEHGVFNGGKRLRPLLTVLAARLCGGAASPAELYRLAMVFEYLHAASLLHDDVIDHADQRRGKKTANALWGNTPVILAGDFLHTRAMELAGTIGGARCLSIIAKATAAMVEAEFLQLANAENRNLSEDDYFKVLAGKTAALISAACETGGIFGGGSAEQCAALHLYGNNLGLAFQIADDLLDYLGDPALTGKAVGNDLLEGKMTLPLIHALANGSAADRQELQQTLQMEREQRAERLPAVNAILERSGSFAYARSRAEQLIAAGLAALDNFTACADCEVLTGLAHYALSRKK